MTFTYKTIPSTQCVKCGCTIGQNDFARLVLRLWVCKDCSDKLDNLLTTDKHPLAGKLGRIRQVTYSFLEGDKNEHDGDEKMC